jgi:hypothetical protein
VAGATSARPRWAVRSGTEVVSSRIDPKSSHSGGFYQSFSGGVSRDSTVSVRVSPGLCHSTVPRLTIWSLARSVCYCQAWGHGRSLQSGAWWKSTIGGMVRVDKGGRPFTVNGSPLRFTVNGDGVRFTVAPACARACARAGRRAGAPPCAPEWAHEQGGQGGCGAAGGAPYPHSNFRPPVDFSGPRSGKSAGEPYRIPMVPIDTIDEGELRSPSSWVG